MVLCNAWSDIMKMSDPDFNRLRQIASSNEFFIVASGADRQNRYTYHLAKELRRCGVELSQDRLAQEARLAAQAITTRICQITAV